MKPLWMVPVGVCLFLAAPEASDALPVSGTVGLSVLPPAGGRTAVAVDLDAGPTGSPWGVMAQYQVEILGVYGFIGPNKPTDFRNPSVVNGLLRYRASAWGEDTLTLFGGLSFARGASSRDDLSLAVDWSQYEPIVGFTYTIRSGRLWINLTPYYVFASPQIRSPWFLTSGLAFVETGVSMGSGIDLSLRLDFTPVRISFHW